MGGANVQQHSAQRAGRDELRPVSTNLTGLATHLTASEGGHTVAIT